jgi:integrase
MAAFTGCRLNELAQLRNGDVQERDGILVLSITDAGEGQSLKTRQSKRLVPVHSALIRVGFKERWQAAKDKGEEFFFHDAPVDRQGRRSEMPGKLFRRLLTRLGLRMLARAVACTGSGTLWSRSSVVQACMTIRLRPWSATGLHWPP